MKKSTLIRFFGVVLLLIISMLAAEGTEAQSGQIQNIDISHNVSVVGQRGMTIHVRFTVSNMRGSTGHIAAYFYYSNGTALTDTNGRYNSANGKVSVGRDFTPQYGSTVFNDFQLFIPYDELHLTGGKYQLKLRVILFHRLGQGYTQFAQSGDTYFDVTFPWQIRTTFDRGDSLAAGDVNGDGKPEILVAEDSNGTIEVYTTGGQRLTPIYSSYDRGGDRIAVGDINRDGRNEILVAEDSGGMIEVYNYPRSARIYTQASGRDCHTTFDSGDGLAAADVNGDGLAEVIVAEDNGGRVGIYTPVVNAQRTQVCYRQWAVISTSYDRGDTLAAGDVYPNRRGAEIIVLEDNGGTATVYGANGALLGRIATTYDSGDSAAMADVLPGTGGLEILVAEDNGGLISSYSGS